MAGSNIIDLNPELLTAAAESKAWPFEEAKKIIERYKGADFPETILFETGYGPSGLPHIGTFGEVARTSMVRHAFRVLTQDKVATKLLCFSDDMDGMRKIPDSVPDRAALEPYLHKPLSSVPNPFGGDYASFADHNNAMLCRFLDTFGFDYEFASATQYYKSGRFDAMLLRAAERYDQIMAVMLPTLGPERQATYSPFLPISPKSGRVLYVPMKHVDAKAGTITFDDDGTETTLPVTGGRVKLQWKPDFGMRWAALGVDFEMFGKDHQTNAVVYDRICNILGGRAPEHFVYELFLDENGQKISKSKGNGLTIDEWLTYAPTESLGLYMYQRPRQAKKLYFDVIPRAVDEYYTFLAAYPRQEWKERLGNPVWHMHDGNPPAIDMPVPFSLLLNLVSASNAQNKEVLWGFISRHVAGVTPATHPELDRLTGYAIRYFDDFVKPTKTFRPADEVEREALVALEKALGDLPAGASGEAIQNASLNVARKIERYQDHSKQSPEGGPGVSGAFFQMIYQVLIGQERGPRFGSFAALYGVAETRSLIQKALAGQLA
ncbi:lysine--tRNA ligase [Mesorhizobium sp. ESP6-5]|uniref:Lysine--tRNA ligase n=1 Tax=Mesorhizobium australicum (strain HAMBI 3006 / LMG 24608 / WSM2073) TaxID=754035 RepID=L0KW10_MESAW|nr:MULTISPECIES: lysine--tRNA ligase [Mesorhizobium]MBZ9931943.1 lysine--tRNA ligase [Mesorhizobium sp. BR1-1-5]AGB48258.1 lysyl-tRNA synthetase, archaeal and spirochete [Mesorhizobium australicum WSM2073]MBZ9682971.1 lysine--tRNA ligase [Mesorhizobium sp. CO1-1-2]MBZ9698059.1 lysine--tRNA ligase [Mesorhizobium sp. CO1-1-9]MBZ9754968.1 lysine--tRNA ligase [Mesorhizobium sp. ESP6-5]